MVLANEIIKNEESQEEEKEEEEAKMNLYQRMHVPRFRS